MVDETPMNLMISHVSVIAHISYKTTEWNLCFCISALKLTIHVSAELYVWEYAEKIC